jgi:hypothetical protein
VQSGFLLDFHITSFGFNTYWKNILDPINWPLEIEANPILFLIEIYFNENLNADIDKIIHYFELSPSEILISSAKIITKNFNHSFNEQLLDSINLNIIDGLSEIQTHLITETLKPLIKYLQLVQFHYGSSTDTMHDTQRPHNSSKQKWKQKRHLQPRSLPH